MLKKLLVSLITLIISLHLVCAQQVSDFFIEGSLNITSFQDEKFSDVIYNGLEAV